LALMPFLIRNASIDSPFLYVITLLSLLACVVY
jgi:hypothetical protein